MQQNYKDNLYHSFNIEPIKSINNKSECSPTGYVEVRKTNEDIVKGK